MPGNGERLMLITRLLLLPGLILAGVAPSATQSLGGGNPSQPPLTLPQNSPASIRVDQFRMPIHPDRNGLSPTMPGTASVGEHASTVIPPPAVHSDPPLELGGLDPTLRQGDICYSIRGYRVTRDDPESDSTRLAGYSTCQPAVRFHLKSALDWGR